MTAQQRIRLDHLLRRGPAACGWDASEWTSDIVAEFIAAKFNVRYHPGHVRRLLKDLGLPLRRPRQVSEPAAQKKERAGR
jgi:transposase